MVSVFWIIIIVVLLILAFIIFEYNKLVALTNRAKEALADIDVQLKRRHDLIPNLVEIVKGYAIHEREVFVKVTEARTKAMEARESKDLKKMAQAENFLAETLKTLFAVAENYPDLKASQNFLELQRELTDTEDKIMAARRFYNANVRDLNIAIESFPTNIIASIFGFKKMDFFEISIPEEKETPKVKF
jgi:LemA protein